MVCLLVVLLSWLTATSRYGIGPASIPEKAMNRKYVAEILTIKLEDSFLNFFNDTFISEVIYLVTNMHANVEFPLTVK